MNDFSLPAEFSTLEAMCVRMQAKPFRNAPGPDDDLRAAGAMDKVVPCNFCGGTGRVGRAVAEIIREACAWAVENYWPAREKAWAKQNGEAG